MKCKIILYLSIFLFAGQAHSYDQNHCNSVVECKDHSHPLQEKNAQKHIELTKILQTGGLAIVSQSQLVINEKSFPEGKSDTKLKTKIERQIKRAMATMDAAGKLDLTTCIQHNKTINGMQEALSNLITIGLAQDFPQSKLAKSKVLQCERLLKMIFH